MNTSQKGFTLAELLIALALLGIIAAFTIPKVLQASATQEATAKIRETVATLEQAWYNQRMSNNVTYGSTLYATVAPTMNTVATNVANTGNPLVGMTPTHPCEDITSAPGSDAGWVQFANGVIISGMANGANLDSAPPTDSSHDKSKNYIICIDYNGAAKPNLPGQDVFIGNFNQYGGFTAAPADDNAAMKSFRWGNTVDAATGNILDTAGAAVVSGADADMGLFNPTAPNVPAAVGTRLTS